MSTFGWEYDIAYEDSIYPASSVAHSTPRRYLPPVESLGTGESWDFAYDMLYPAATPAAPFFSIPVSGTYEDMGLEAIVLDGIEHAAWHIRSSYTMELTATGVFTRDYPAEADFWYVEGMGLVREIHIDIETESVILERNLVDMVWDEVPDDGDTGLDDTGMEDTGTETPVIEDTGTETPVIEDTGTEDSGVSSPPFTDSGSVDTGEPMTDPVDTGS